MDGGAGEIGLVMWVLLVLIGALVIVGVFGLLFGMPFGVHREKRQRKAALRVLDERYARGEIPRTEYENKRRELGGSPSAG